MLHLMFASYVDSNFFASYSLGSSHTEIIVSTQIVHTVHCISSFGCIAPSVCSTFLSLHLTKSSCILSIQLRSPFPKEELLEISLCLGCASFAFMRCLGKWKRVQTLKLIRPVFKILLLTPTGFVTSGKLLSLSVSSFF